MYLEQLTISNYKSFFEPKTFKFSPSSLSDLSKVKSIESSSCLKIRPNQADFDDFCRFFSRLPHLFDFQAQYGHALDIPGQTNQIPLPRDLLQTAQGELAKPHHRLDDPEDWLNRLFAQGISSAPCHRSQAMRHGLNR